MKQKSMILSFPKEQIEKPLISELVRDFDVSINILEAHISPAEGGKMFIIMQAKTDKLMDTALKHIRKQGIDLVLPSKNLLWDQEKCVDCGACVVHCYPGALALDKDAKLVYDDQKCIACGLCVPACSYGAIETVEGHLNKERYNG